LTVSLSATDKRQLQVTALLAVVTLLIAAGLAVALHPPGRTVTAYFRSAEAVFSGNSVRVLGVPVGTITEVVPEGTRVRVRMELFDDDARLPADARAVVIAPSLVTGRYVQLTPTWSGGPELVDGAVIPLERTAVPLGVDDLSRTATELSRALGPNGVNAEGALSDALDVGAANLGGNGQAFNDTVRDLGELTGTLSGSREELFGTVTELQSFVSMVAANDAEVREFNRRLADVSGFLADERDDLAAALGELSVALGEVADFVRDNRQLVESDVDRLVDVTEVLARQQDALAATLDIAPDALGNLADAYNASSGTLDTGADLNELTLPFPVLVCELARRTTSGKLPPDVEPACAELAENDAPSPAEVITALQAGKPPVPGLAVPAETAGGAG
jgi:phospholipid/cholesterol/gamma-HCH transport system substrate-binding protein